ncbi:MAG: acetate uptake transporter [Spirochaetales bacterium]|nr:acetate uptake transporter [Spirochaetales bacterium]
MSTSQGYGNPAPLGLLGFGLTTILLNIHNAGFFPLTSMILSMGIFVGGIAQLIAGIQEWKVNNTFGATAFTLYGCFWLSFAVLNLLPASAVTSSGSFDIGFYLLVWGVFSLFMFVGTLRISMAHQIIFSSLTVLFFLLAIGDFTGSHMVKTIAGFEGIFCGISACYTAVALILNELYGKIVMPLGMVNKLTIKNQDLQAMVS